VVNVNNLKAQLFQLTMMLVIVHDEQIYQSCRYRNLDMHSIMKAYLLRPQCYMK